MRTKTNSMLPYGIGNLWLRILMIVGVLTYAIGLQAQSTANFPFPQNYKYPYGITATNASSTGIQSIYAEWKSKYYTEDMAKGQARIKFLQPGEDGSATVSEGIGYGMLIMVYMDNATNNTKGCFDKLLAYYKASLDANGLMNWKMSAFSGTVIDANAAPDADIDVAQALLLAYKQWNQQSYLDEANTLMGKIWLYETQVYSGAGGARLLKPGDMFTAVLNPSYFITNAFKLFKQAGHGQDWNTFAQNHYDLVKKCQNTTTGLIPDWVWPDGSLITSGQGLGDACKSTADASGIACGKFESYFLYDAVRVPWRFAQAYGWYGDADAKAIVSKIAAWAQGAPISGTPQNAKDGYKLNGTLATGLSSPLNNKGLYSNACFTGGIGISGMVDATYQSFLNSTFSETVKSEGSNSQYFTTTTQLLYLLCMSGNMPNYWDMNPTPQKAYNNATGGCSKIYVEFNKPMKSSTVSTTGWTVTMDNANTPIPVTVSSATLQTDTKTILLTLAAPTEEPKIEVAYSGTSLQSADGKTVAAFTGLSVTDNLFCARPYIDQAGSDLYGTAINVMYSKPMEAATIVGSQFTVKVNGATKTIATAIIDPDNSLIVKLTFASSILASSSDVITLSYTGSTLRSQDGGAPKTVTDMPVKNNFFVVTCLDIEKVDPLSNAWVTSGTSTVSTSTSDPDNALVKVLKFTKGTGTANQYSALQGSLPSTTTSDSTLNARLLTNYIFKARIRSDKAGAVVRLRLQDKRKAGNAWESAIQTSYTCTAANTWYNVSFNFEEVRDIPTNLNQIQFDVEPDVAVTTTVSLYIDDIQLCPADPTPAPRFAYTSYKGNEIKIKFNFDMAVPSSTSAYTVTVGTATYSVTSAAVDAADKSLVVLTLSSPLTTSDNNVTISFNGTGTKALVGVPVDAFTNLTVLNLVDRAVTNGWMDDFDNDKDFITANISKSTNYSWVEDAASSPGKLTVTVSGTGDYLTFGPTVEDAVNKEVWDMSNDKNVYFRCKVAAGQTGGNTVYMRVDLKDLERGGRLGRTTDGMVAIPITVDGAYHDYTINYAGKFSNSYGASPGPVDKTSIAAAMFYIWKNKGSGGATAALWNGTVDFDYIWVGNSVRIKSVSATSVPQGGSVSVTAYQAGKVFIVPGGTPRVYESIRDSILHLSGVSATVTANTAKTINLSSLSAGYYVVYAYDQTTGRLSRQFDGIDITDNTPPSIVQASSGNYSPGDLVSVVVDEDAWVYLVPSTTAANKASIQGATNVVSVFAYANQVATLNISGNSAPGDKLVFYAIDLSSSENISAKSTQIITIVDVKAPVLSNTSTGDFVQPTANGQSVVKATINESGTIYIISSANIANITNAASLATYNSASKTATAGTPTSFDLMSITPPLAVGSYVFYAVDASGNMAGPSASFNVTQGCVAIDSVAISPGSLSITAGQTANATFSIIKPVGAGSASISTVIWSASKISGSGTPTIFSLVQNADNSVTVTGNSTAIPVQAKLNVVIDDCTLQNTVSATIIVTISPAASCPTAVSVDATASLQAGGTKTLTPTLTGGTGTETVLWSTSDATKVTVDASGVITAVATTGTTPVLVIAKMDCDNTISDTCVVTVTGIPVSSITVSTLVDSVVVGSTLQASAAVLPANASNATVDWSSSATGIATVNANGLISAVSVGSVTITATAKDGSGITGTKTIRVVPVHVTDITVTPNPVSMLVNSTKTITQALTPTVVPSTATVKTVTWSITDQTIATISTAGVITSLKAGSTTITCTSVQDPLVKVTIPLTVTDKLPTSVTVKATETVGINASVVLTATVTPDDAVNTSVTWTSLDQTIATVSANGTVTGKAVGTIGIVVASSAVSTITDTCYVTVSPTLVTSVSVSPAKLGLKIGQKSQLTVNVQPTNASNPSVTWSSSDEAIATVAADGTVKAVSEGIATITATSNDGSNKSSSCEVTVSPVLPTSISANDISMLLSLTAGKQIIYTIAPDTATNKNVTFTLATGGGAICAVSSTGLVTPVGEGTTTIVITSEAAPGVFKEITVTVSKDVVDVTDVTLDNTTLSIGVNNTQQLKATETLFSPT